MEYIVMVVLIGIIAAYMYYRLAKTNLPRLEISRINRAARKAEKNFSEPVN